MSGNVEEHYKSGAADIPMPKPKSPSKKKIKKAIRKGYKSPTAIYEYYAMNGKRYNLSLIVTKLWKMRHAGELRLTDAWTFEIVGED